MRIAVIGSGAVGCLYGARLAQSGHDVRFLMRRDLEAVRANGLTIKSCDGDFHIAAQAFGSSAEIGEVDLVLCALKATSMDVAESLIRPCVGPETGIVAMINGLGIEEQFGQWFGPKRIFGGLAFVCINRGEPGMVHHLEYGRLALGHLMDDRKQTQALANLFAEAGFDASVRPSLRQARWEKLGWNVPFSTLAITAGAVTTREIMDDEGLAAMAERLIVEVGMAGNADGCQIDIDAMAERMMTNTATMGPYKPSMLIDYENKVEIEVEAILGEPVRRAKRLGVAVPTMELQYRLCAFLDRLNRGVVEQDDE